MHARGDTLSFGACILELEISQLSDVLEYHRPSPYRTYKM